MDKKRIAECAKIMKEIIIEIIEVEDNLSNEDSPFTPKDYTDLIVDSHNIFRIFEHYKNLLESAEGESA